MPLFLLRIFLDKTNKNCLYVLFEYGFTIFNERIHTHVITRFKKTLRVDIG